MVAELAGLIPLKLLLLMLSGRAHGEPKGGLSPLGNHCHGPKMHCHLLILGNSYQI